MKSISIYFHTSEQVKAPYSYQYHLHCTFYEENVGIHIKMLYTHREGFTPLDLVQSGCSGNDNFQWSGTFPKSWMHALKKVMQESSFTFYNAENKEKNHLQVHMDGARAMFVENQLEWEYILSELIQGITEKAQNVDPLQIRYKIVGEECDQHFVLVIPKFSERKVNVQSYDLKGYQREPFMPWDQLKNFMQNIYSSRIQHDQALSHQPLHKGSYLDIGEGLWYQLGVGIRNANRDRDSVRNIERQFNALL